MRLASLLLLFSVVATPCLTAQHAMALPDSLIVPGSGAPIRWWHAAVAVGLVGTTIVVADAPVRRGVQGMRSRTTDDVATILRQMGRAPVYLGVPAALTAAGLIGNDDGVARAGGRMLTAVLLSAAATQGAKRVLGRRRPSDEQGATAFELFAFDDAALPSGHASGAFALATSAAMELRHPIATAVLFTAATGSAWSRLNDEKHWLGDVMLGAAIGVTSAHLVQGKWRLFNIRPPMILRSPSGQTSIGYTASF